VRVLLAVGHTMFREGLGEMLASDPYEDEVEVVGKTAIGEEAVALAKEKNPEVKVMQVDWTLKKLKGTLKQMREGSSTVPKVIILTMFEELRMMPETMALGANAYTHKSASVEELFAVLRVSAGRGEGEHAMGAMPQQALELSKGGLGKDGAGSVLTRRELEILLLAARGMTKRGIASHLNIAEETGKRHLANVYPRWAWPPGEKRYAWTWRTNGSPYARSRRP
jgi:DNA-binding NarL/FixJ family response regulator